MIRRRLLLSQRSFQRVVVSFLGAIALTIGLWLANSALLMPQGVAQSNQDIETAAVVIDGQPLFEVTALGEDTAQERADAISAMLADAIDTTATISRVGLTLSLVNAAGEEVENEALLTVSKNDIRAVNRTEDPDLLAEQIAARWATTIEAALDQAREQRSPDFFRRALLLSLAAVMFAAIAYWWLRRIQRRVMPQPLQALQHLLKEPESDNDQIRTSLVRISASMALILARIAIWGAAIIYVINLFPQTRDRGYEIFRAVRDSFFSPLFPLGDNTYSVTDLFILIGAFLGVFVGATVVTNVLRSRILNMAVISTGAQEAIATLTRYTLIAIGSIVVLQVWGLDLSSLTLIASALGVGIGFGFQNIAKDFGSGLILLFERPVQVGDFVEVGEFKGTVDRIGARSTNVKTLDQISIIVPNSYFLENQVINWSHENPLSRIAIPVGVSYNADPEHVRDILLKAAESHPGVVQLPKPQVFFKGFGDSSLDFLLLVWIVEPNRQPSIKSDLYFQVFALFKQEGIEIPFPQRDLHLRSGHLPVDMNTTYHPSTSKSADHPMG